MKIILLTTFLLSLNPVFAQDSQSFSSVFKSFFNLFASEKQIDCDDGIDRKVIDSTIEQDGQKIAISSVSLEYLNELFQELANDKEIPFNYPEDGCYARAHKMAMILDDKGITSAKNFVFGSLFLETPKAHNGYVMWVYHVAPMVQVRTESGLKNYIIDPSLFNRPVPEDEWIELMRKNKTMGEHPIARVSYHNQYTYMPFEEETKKRFSYLDKKNMKKTLHEYMAIQRTRENAKLHSNTSDINPP